MVALIVAAGLLVPAAVGAGSRYQPLPAAARDGNLDAVKALK